MNQKRLCPFEKDGSTTFCQTSKKPGNLRGCDENKEELAEEEKVILIHYEQRKVMLSQLHPTEVPDAEPPSDLRQVQKRASNRVKEAVTVCFFF